MDNEFRTALENNDLELLQKIPKTDLHNHAMLGARLHTLEKWIGYELEKPPDRMNSLEDMNAYVDKVLEPYLLTKKGFEFSIEAALADAMDDGVSLIEMSVDCYFNSFYPDGAIGLGDFLTGFRQKLTPKIHFRPELGLSRKVDIKTLETWAIPCMETGCFHSIDLYDIEDAQEPEVFKGLYDKARRQGMKLKAHVGEFGSAESIRHTVEILELAEVQHGIAAAKSPEIMKWLRDNAIRLNICPTSNVMLGRVKSLQAHPIRKLYDNGVMVTINSDDIMIFNQSVSEEYVNMLRSGVFSAGELDDIRHIGLGLAATQPET